MRGLFHATPRWRRVHYKSIRANKAFSCSVSGGVNTRSKPRMWRETFTLEVLRTFAGTCPLTSILTFAVMLAITLAITLLTPEHLNDSGCQPRVRGRADSMATEGGGGRGARGCDSYISVGSCRYRGARASNGGVRPPPVPREVGLSGPPGHGHVYGEQ